MIIKGPLTEQESKFPWKSLMKKDLSSSRVIEAEVYQLVWILSTVIES